MKRIQAEAEAEQTRIEAEAEAYANNVLNNSITENLIKMKEAEARMEHGWVTVQGASAVVQGNKECMDLIAEKFGRSTREI